MGNITPTNLLDKKSPKLTSEDIEKNASQSGQILSLLVAAGARGCTNEQLWGIFHAVNSRMGDLREQGYTIRSKRERGRIWRYWLESAPADPQRPPLTFEQRAPHRRGTGNAAVCGNVDVSGQRAACPEAPVSKNESALLRSVFAGQARLMADRAERNLTIDDRSVANLVRIYEGVVVDALMAVAPNS